MTSLAEAQNAIAKQALNPDSIKGIVDKAFTLGEGIAGLFGENGSTRITHCMKGTVVRVNNDGAFAAYGGTFQGYGSTPDTRNGVIEVTIAPNTPKPHDYSKQTGGVAYIYDGVFEAFNGANVFNMVRTRGASGLPDRGAVSNTLTSII